MTKFLISERTVTVVISLNLIAVFLLGFDDLRHEWGTVLVAIDYSCLIYFVAELIVKIRVFGFSEFWSKTLNRVDFVLIGLASPELLLPFVDSSYGEVLVLLRCCRFLRLLRGLRFIPHAELLWRGIGRALRASVGLILALFLYDIIIALFARQLFSELAPELFGDPLTSAYTIFTVFTVEGWQEVPAVVIQNLPPDSIEVTFVRAFFVFTVLTGGLLGLSLTNAVLVDEMVVDNTRPIQEQVENLEMQIRALTEITVEQFDKVHREVAELDRDLLDHDDP